MSPSPSAAGPIAARPACGSWKRAAPTGLERRGRIELVPYLELEREMALIASDIMTRNVVSIGPDDIVRDIAAKLSEHEISAVPVCDETGRVVGIVSEGDLMKPFGSANMLKRAWWLDLLAEGDELAPDFLNYIKMDHRHARDLMSAPVLTASEDTLVSELADVMTSHRVKRLPILHAGKLVGVVSRSDIVRTLVDVGQEVAHVT